LVSDDIISYLYHIIQWIGGGGDSNHLLVFLEIKKGGKNPLGPFKFNLNLLGDEDYIDLVKVVWYQFDGIS
jgi:hypothetical protein